VEKEAPQKFGRLPVVPLALTPGEPARTRSATARRPRERSPARA